MRNIIIASLVPAAISITAVAHSAPVRAPLRVLVATDLPERCRPLAEIPESAVIPGPDFAAHLSVANCGAEEAMGSVTLRPDAASVAALEAASAASTAIFDDIIQHGDAPWKAAASAAKADMLIGMVVRMRSVANDPSDHAGIEPKLGRWVDAAAALAQPSH